MAKLETRLSQHKEAGEFFTDEQIQVCIKNENTPCPNNYPVVDRCNAIVLNDAIEDSVGPGELYSDDEIRTCYTTGNHGWCEECPVVDKCVALRLSTDSREVDVYAQFTDRTKSLLDRWDNHHRISTTDPIACIRGFLAEVNDELTRKLLCPEDSKGCVGIDCCDIIGGKTQ